jgi:hypothetical protein
MSRATRFSLFLTLTWLCLGAVCLAFAPGATGKVCNYRISSKGFGVGRLKTVIAPVQQDGGRAVRFQSDLAVDANLLFFRVNSSAREDAVISEKGTQSYRRAGKENGSQHQVEGVLEGDCFRFRIGVDGASRSVVVPRSSYDCTTMDCPETTMRREGDVLEVRLLDLEHARVVTRRLHWVKSEEVDVGGRRLNCRVVDISDPANRCRRWVSCGPDGMVIARQDGQGRYGSYSLKLVSLSELPG